MRVESKKIKGGFIVFIIVIISILIGGYFLYNSRRDSKEEFVSDAVRFKREYESVNNKKTSSGKRYRELSIPEDNHFIYQSAKDIIERVSNKETFVVYFGFNECPWCRSVLPSLIQASTDIGIEQIYYVDIKEIRDRVVFNDEESFETEKKGTSEYYELLVLFKDVLDDYVLTTEDGKKVNTGEKRIFAPNVITVVRGKPKSNVTGISDKQTDSFMELTEEMLQDSYDQFKESFRLISKSNSCSKDGLC